MASGMESISKVEEAEGQAKELVEKAERAGRKLVEEANDKAAAMVESSARKTEGQKAARIGETVKRLEDENRRAVANAQKEAARIRNRKVSKEVLGRLAGKVADLILGE